MSSQKRIMFILIGPAVWAISVLLLSSVLTVPGAQAVGILFWMIFWWITRPVHITVAAILPVLVNAMFNIVPMGTVTAQYVSPSIILIFGAGLICMPWASIGLDRRIALKILSVVGPSMKSQITVWLLASVLLSSVLPNVMVCALLTSIAIPMLSAVGEKDIAASKPAVPILLAISWGVGMGGSGTPLGGAMNLVAIDFLEQHITKTTGKPFEFMYIDWVINIAPYFIIGTIVLLITMLLMPTGVKNLEGTREYFRESYEKLGPMNREEKICAVLFFIATSSAFARPLYDDLLPALAPAYIFLIVGCLSFFLSASDKSPLLTWELAQKNTMWGMMILFGGGLAIGEMINGSGASAKIAELISKLSLDGGLTTIIVFVVLARVISELTNSTTAAAVCIPIILGFATKLGLNPIPYWFIMTMAYNAEFVLPISVRAIPVAYGLDANKMLKRGLPATIINIIIVIVVSYACMQLWPSFGQISYQ